MTVPSIKYFDAIALKIKTSAEWTSQNPVLFSGEIGLESDTLRMKIGNGADRFSDLTYTDAELRNRVEALENFARASAQLMSSTITNNEKYS